MEFRKSKITGKPFPINGFSKPMPFTKDHISLVPDATGVYVFLDKTKTPIYAGRTIDRKYSGLRHRIQSYDEKDDFNEHPTKKALRPHINSFMWKKTTEAGAKELEDKLKQHMKYNADNKYNEEKKLV